MSGTLPQSCMPSPPPTRRAKKKVPTTFLTPDGNHWEFYSRHRILLSVSKPRAFTWQVEVDLQVN